jgi:hypothetical protein
VLKSKRANELWDVAGEMTTEPANDRYMAERAKHIAGPQGFKLFVDHKKLINIFAPDESLKEHT